jgi:hypothetical protein
MKQALPPQLKHIVQTEGKAKDLATCLQNIEIAKQNELKSYLALCKVRLQLE